MRVAVLLALAFVLAGCAMGGTTKTVTVTTTMTSPAGPKKPPAAQAETGDVKFFGTPVSITRLDATRYALTLKPQYYLVGVTANVAFADSQQVACAPLACAAVPDDRWVIPAGTQDLVFILPGTVTGTVLNPQEKPVTVTASQLANLVAGAKTPKLIEPLDSGVWVTVDVDTVTAFAQQFQP